MTAPNQAIPPGLRFKRANACPACGGWSTQPKGGGKRCYGFLSADGTWAHCTRPERAGDLVDHAASGTYAHRLDGPCRCGYPHAESTAATWTAAKAAKPAKETSAYALALWERSRPTGELVARYLASRGLEGPIPRALRYLPEEKHKDSGRWLPVMLAGVTRWPGTRPVAVHRTYLRTDGSGKADVEPQRMALGPIAGGAVRLAEPGSVLVVAEGIETALSVQLATGLPVWAVLGSSNMAGLVLPPLPLAREVVIAADRDDAGVLAARKAAGRWVRDGRRVRIALPPAGCGDFNDAVERKAT